MAGLHLLLEAAQQIESVRDSSADLDGTNTTVGPEVGPSSSRSFSSVSSRLMNATSASTRITMNRHHRCYARTYSGMRVPVLSLTHDASTGSVKVGLNKSRQPLAELNGRDNETLCTIPSFRNIHSSTPKRPVRIEAMNSKSQKRESEQDQKHLDEPPFWRRPEDSKEDIPQAQHFEKVCEQGSDKLLQSSEEATRSIVAPVLAMDGSGKQINQQHTTHDDLANSPEDSSFLRRSDMDEQDRPSKTSSIVSFNTGLEYHPYLPIALNSSGGPTRMNTMRSGKNDSTTDMVPMLENEENLDFSDSGSSWHPSDHENGDLSEDDEFGAAEDTMFINDCTLDEYFHRFKIRIVQENKQESENSSDSEEDEGESLAHPSSNDPNNNVDPLSCSNEPVLNFNVLGEYAEGGINESLSEKSKIGNRRKKNRLLKEKGLPYKKWDGTMCPARQLQPSCNCKLKCSSKYNESVRTKILQHLLGLDRSGQTQFLSAHMSVFPSARSRVKNSQRAYTHKYFLPGVKDAVPVCKVMYMATFDVGDRKIRCLAKKLNGTGMATDDQRGNNVSPKKLTEEEILYIKDHIRSFPLYSSHYSREKSSKLYLSGDLNVTTMHNLYKKKCEDDNLIPVHYTTYLALFKSMRLGFKKPSVDTCGKCDQLRCAIKRASGAEQMQLQAQLSNHLGAAERVYSTKKADVATAKSDPSVRSISFDLQKQLPTPHLTCGQAFYSRQLYVYNLTVFSTQPEQNTGTCFLWDETLAGRGSDSIGSSVHKYLTQLPASVETVTMYSDRCSGQNRNKNIVFMLSHFVECCLAEGKSMRIDHAFMVSGHSHMAVDSIHAAIERAKKRLTVNIEVPEDWAIMIGSIQRATPLQVVQMKLEDFLKFSTLENRYQIPKLDTNGEKVRFADIMVFSYNTSHPHSVKFKYDIGEARFKEMKIIKERDLVNPMNVIIPVINTERIKLSDAKADDLRKLMKFVEKVDYYKELLQRVAPAQRGRKRKRDSTAEREVEYFDDDLDPADNLVEEDD